MDPEINIHFIGVGYDPVPILEVLKSNLPCDRICLLWNNEPKIVDSKNRIVRNLMEGGFDQDDIVTQKVDAFDYNDILNNIMKITLAEKKRSAEIGCKAQFFFNITHGTRLDTAALSTAAMIVGSQMYYYKERDDSTAHISTNNLIIRIPVPKMPDLDKLTTQRRRFLKMVCSKEDGATVNELSGAFNSKQNVNQFVGFFEENKFVERIRDGKYVRIKATDLGKMAANWIL